MLNSLPSMVGSSDTMPALQEAIIAHLPTNMLDCLPSLMGHCMVLRLLSGLCSLFMSLHAALQVACHATAG